MSTLFRDKKAGAGKDVLVRAPRMKCQLGAGKGRAFRDMPRNGEDRLLLGKPGLLEEMTMVIVSISACQEDVGEPCPQEQTIRGTKSFSYKQEGGWTAGTVGVGFRWVSGVCWAGKDRENEGTDRPLGIKENRGVPKRETGERQMSAFSEGSLMPWSPSGTGTMT